MMTCSAAAGMMAATAGRGTMISITGIIGASGAMRAGAIGGRIGIEGR
jgi:hypothetical protein